MGKVPKKGHGPQRPKASSRHPPPRSSGQKRHHDQASQRPDKPPIREPPKNSWFGLVAELLGTGPSIGEEHDGIFVSGKPAKTLSDAIKEKLKSGKRIDQTLLLLYAEFAKACERQPGVSGGGSGLFNAKIYDGVPEEVQSRRCKSIMRSTRFYSRIQDGLIRIPCTKIRLGSGSVTDLIPLIGGPGAALINFFFYFLSLRRVGLKAWRSIRIVGFKLAKDAVLTAIPILGAPTGTVLQTTPRLTWTTSTWALLRDVLEDSYEVEGGKGVRLYRSPRLEGYFGDEELPFTAALRNAFGGKDDASSNV